MCRGVTERASDEYLQRTMTLKKPLTARSLWVQNGPFEPQPSLTAISQEEAVNV